MKFDRSTRSSLLGFVAPSLYRQTALSGQPLFSRNRITQELNSSSNSATTMTASYGRRIAKLQDPTPNGPIFRLIGTTDIDGKGTTHPLPQVNPFMLLDVASLPQSDLPPFGAHPHRGHSVVTLLLQGQEKSWDSVTQKETVVQAPASYWVDAGAGIFHDEVSVVPDPNDPLQHVKLLQLWVSVKEEDRLKPAALQYDDNLPQVDAKNADGQVVGNIVYFVGGGAQIQTPHPVVVAHVRQDANSLVSFPVPAGFGGFVVNLKGSPITFLSGGFDGHNQNAPKDQVVPVTSDTVHQVLVLADDEEDSNSDSEQQDSVLQISSQDLDVEYLVCVGEKIDEPWYKKLVANGAVVAQSEDEARAIATQVETYAAAGKGETKSFAPFGL
jgi:redox-sensitive bicupin YhaK (pirin superfamily)